MRAPNAFSVTSVASLAFVVHVLSCGVCQSLVTAGTGTHAWVAPRASAISMRVTTSKVRQRPGAGVNERSCASAMPGRCVANGKVVAAVRKRRRSIASSGEKALERFRRDDWAVSRPDE